jgi:AraC family transcriptional regulator of adaptative response / methylphosphotriester-DNA alkyltransferase methyltransferase
LKRWPCDIYEVKLMEIVKELILQTDLPTAEVARQLTFDPSNFSKFFNILKASPQTLAGG